MTGAVLTKGSKGKECADHQRTVHFQADSLAHKCGFEATGTGRKLSCSLRLFSEQQ